MATIRTKFRSSSAEGREGALYYQVIHNRVVRQISTGYKLFASEWDQRSEAVIPCQHPAGMERDNYLLSVGERIRRDKIRLEKAIRTLSQSGPFTADDIVIRFHDSGQEPSFNDYIRQQIVRLKRLGKIRTSETYTAALKSFSSFMKGSDILFGELSSDLLMEYEAYLKNRGNSPNTISFYMRILKAVYNRAVENGLTGQRNLFKSVYTGVEKTLKRAIHLNDIRRIKRLDLSLKPHLDFARDMFLCGHGLSEKGRHCERNPDLPQEKDRTTAVHPMGKVYAGDHQTFLFIGSRFQSCSLIALLVISRVLFVRDSTNK